jgi:hypothetical protein
MASRVRRVVAVTVGDVLDGHVALDLDCLDRLYLHGYLARLQVGGQVVQFLRHRGFPVPSPACLQQIGDTFRRRVASFAEANHIPVVPLKATDRNIDVMRPYLEAAAATGRSQIAAIGVAQEPQRVFPARKRHTDSSKPPQFSFEKKDRWVMVYYFYLWDASASSAAAAMPATCWRSVTSHRMASQRPPRAAISPAAPVTSSSERAQTATAAPASPRARAMARPKGTGHERRRGRRHRPCAELPAALHG